MLSKGEQTRKHCFSAGFPQDGQTRTHCFRKKLREKHCFRICWGKVRICFHNISKNGENRENSMRHWHFFSYFLPKKRTFATNCCEHTLATRWSLQGVCFVFLHARDSYSWQCHTKSHLCRKCYGIKRAIFLKLNRTGSVFFWKFGLFTSAFLAAQNFVTALKDKEKIT